VVRAFRDWERGPPKGYYYLDLGNEREFTVNELLFEKKKYRYILDGQPNPLYSYWGGKVTKKKSFSQGFFAPVLVKKLF